MRTCRFVIADVFTEKRFGGNQLAVFLNAGGLDPGTMQDLALEMNYSETTFVLPPETTGDFRVRIFTPARELPFAGHPIVGTSFVIFFDGLKQFEAPLEHIKLETGAGIIEVAVSRSSEFSGYSVMSQPLPQLRAEIGDIDLIAEALSLPASALERTGLPCQALHNGLTVLLVPVDSLKSVQQIKVDPGKIEKVAAGVAAETVLVFARETLRPESNVHCRVFAPGAGVGEDAATGSANGPLGYYLVKHRLVTPDTVTGLVRIISEQGYEMNRPSTIHIDVEVDSRTSDIIGVKVGGGVVIAGTGEALVEAG